MHGVRPLSLVCSLALSACGHGPSPADLGSAAAPQAVTAAGAWPSPGGDSALTRHSALTQITPANVGQLEVAWTFASPVQHGGQEGGPLVVGDTLFLHSPFPNPVVAINLADHRVRWTYAPTQDNGVVPLMCCDVVSRGLAWGPAGGGTVYLQQADATLVALDARTGQRRWQVRNGDPKVGATATNAPQVFDHYVLTGIAGGEYGVRGYLSAFDADTGRLAWRGYSTGPDADLLIDPVHSTTWRDGHVVPVGPDSSLNSWQAMAWQHGGGTTWGWTAYDPVLRLVYYGSGNPGAWNPVQRPGDNRWAMALWARDIDTGRVRWVYQMTPHDQWDYDGVNEPILFDATDAQGRPRHLLQHFDRNGFAYTLDRATGALLAADQFDPSVNWATHIDLPSGRPVLDPAHAPEAQGEDETTAGICPAAIGAKNQAPAAYDAALGLFFVPTNHLCMDFEPFHIDYTAGQPYIGATARTHAVPGDEATLGRFIAWDARQHRIAWAVPERAPVWSGALSTASGLVFYGTLDAHLKAVDARTGALRWTSPTLPSGIVGNVTTWAFEGRQYVGVLTGVGGLANDPAGIGGLRKQASSAPAAPVPVDGPLAGLSRNSLVVFALPR
jgi:PQQ-dependent dehydrogenase (methanol/ethanol family)